MYGGTITGEYISLDKNNKIEMNWKMKDWESFSHVLITFENVEEDVTLL